jgi:hypothetical protein
MQVVDLPNKVSAGLTTMVSSAVYDLESLRKVRCACGLCVRVQFGYKSSDMAFLRLLVAARAASSKLQRSEPEEGQL